MKTTAAVLLAVLVMAGSAQALTVSPGVGPLLMQAQKLLMAKDFKGARAKLDEAEAVKVSTDDEIVINQIRRATEACENGICPTQP